MEHSQRRKLIITKENKPMYFLELRKADVLLSDIVNFYCTCVRLLLKYCVPVFYHSYLAISARILRDFKRHSYWDNLASVGLKPLQSWRKSLCLKLFQSILRDERFCNLLSPRHKASYNLLSPCDVFAQTGMKDLLSQTWANILIRSFKYILHWHIFF